ncbi:MAG: hypothetical protein IT319_02255 [Anaerolineae bacterium]|nr:hypothetical protein [Anaerolineae bacterium]
MADDLISELRALANRWAMRARDYARASKEEGATEAQANYNRGFADGYYKAATELATLLTNPGTAAAPQPKPASSAPVAGAAQPRPAAPQRPATPPPAAPAPAAPPESPKPQVKYASVSVGEAVSILVFAGCQPRDVTPNKDNSLHATFSSWGSLMLHEQVDRVRSADPRIIILSSGKMESHDYYIDFAFKETSLS